MTGETQKQGRYPDNERSTGFIRLQYGAGKVIEPFLFRLFGEKNPKMIYWVSPWITHLDFRIANTKKLLQKIQFHRAGLIIVTRIPEAGSPHEAFIRDVKEMLTASIFYMPTLHAKFYIVTTQERRYALLGSANMYKWSKRSYELGIVIEARGQGEVLVDDLERLAIDLRVAKNTKRI